MTNTVELPWPPKALSPNARGHWSKRHKAAKKYRRDCALLARAVRLQAPAGELLLHIEFVPAVHRNRDDDNLIASFKAGRDGLADALGIDDNRFHTKHTIADTTVPGGAVRVRIEQRGEGGRHGDDDLQGN